MIFYLCFAYLWLLKVGPQNVFYAQILLPDRCVRCNHKLPKANFTFRKWYHAWGWGSTVVSAYIPPGYKPTSASVPLKKIPDCFCYPLHPKASLFSPPVISTNRLQSSKIVLPDTQKSVCKPTAESYLLKLVNQVQRAADEHILIVANAS